MIVAIVQQGLSQNYWVKIDPYTQTCTEEYVALHELGSFSALVF